MLDTKLLWATQSATDLTTRLHFRSILPVAQKFYYLDLAFPLFYANLLSSLYTRGLGRSTPARRFLSSTPYFAGAFDLLENLSILRVLWVAKGGGEPERYVCVFGGLMTLCKWNR